MNFKISRFNVFLLIWLTLLTFWIASSNGIITVNIPKQIQNLFANKNTVNLENKDKEVPELKDILGPDQTTRLKATRKLVERVDVEEALENVQDFITLISNAGQGFVTVGDGYDTWHAADGNINFDADIPTLDSLLIPIFGTILGVVFLEEALTVSKVLGCFLIIISIKFILNFYTPSNFPSLSSKCSPSATSPRRARRTITPPSTS